MAECVSFAARYFRVLFCLYLVYSTAGSCDETALGMANGYIVDSEITSSSVHNSSTPSKNGRLNYSAGSSWCAAASDSSPFLQIDLEIRHIICAVATQGNSKGDQWVKKYKLKFSTDNTTWHDYKERGTTKSFLGNLDRRTVVKHMLFTGIDARYLRILPEEYHVGTCFRVELYGRQVRQENLALYKPTSQSSTMGDFVSSKAVDGKRITNINYCTHTIESSNPWWRVDLGKVESVSELYIVNRGDCCGNRLSGFEISVGNATTGGGVSNHLCGSGLGVPQGQGKAFYCKPVARGRYVHIRIPGNNRILTLCGVEVYGMTNLALKQPAVQSSTSGGLASRAVDGKASTNWGDNTCTHTNTETNPWWRVDLGSSFPVAEIFIVNRDCSDACGDRFKGFEIRIGNDDRNGGISNPRCGTGLLSLNRGQKKSFFCLPRLVGRYVYIRIPGWGKILTICELEVYTRLRKYTACSTEPVGIADNSIIPNYRLSASSSRSGNEPYNGRLRGNSAWFPLTSTDSNDYLQIDLGSVYFVCAVATQGNPTNTAWTTKYKIETSLNNVTWTTYKEDNTEKIFDGNNDRSGIIKRNLKQSPAAKFVRFYPRGYSGNKALRVEVYGTKERCQASLGMEDNDIADAAITVSSRLDSSHNKSSSRLYSSSSSWCSSTSSISEYLQVDLGHVKTVTGVATQGDPSSNKWVTKYNILYRYDGKTWITHAVHQGLTGNTDKSSVVVNWFSVPFAAQFVKVVPLTWNTAVCLRVDFYGCDHFIVPFLYIAEFADVTLPTQAVDSSVVLRVQAEFTSQRPAKFSWSNNGNSLSETASAITVKYKSAEQTWNNYHCVRRSLTRREIYCNTTYSCSVSVPDIPGLTKFVQANVTALLTVPRRPSVRQVTQGDINARTTTVRWTQPNPGADEAPIRYFELQYTNQSFTSTLTISSPSTGSKQLTNLKPYTDYRVKMMANSILGNGLWSVTRTFKTSTAVPEVAPSVTNATALSSESIYIEWQKPDLNKVNGPLAKYIVVYNATGASEETLDIDKSRTSQTLGNLKKWTVYKIQLRVNNSDFNGPLSVEKEVRTLQDAPSAPRDLVITEQPASGSSGPTFSVTWKKPAEENGIIIGYKLKYSYSLDSKPVSGQYNLSGVQLSHTFTVLGGVAYTVKVSAETIKPGPEAKRTKQVATYKPSTAPQGIIRLKINETTYNITWQPLSRAKSNGRILTYEVKRSEVSASRQKRSLSSFYKNTTATFFVLSNLKVCTKYQVEVRAYTTAGPGSFGAPDHAVETSAPVAPTSLDKLSQTKRSVKLKWEEPDIGEDKQTFTIMYKGTKGYYPEFKDVRVVSSIQTTEYALKDLYPGTKYEFSVSATSRCGVGDNSSILPLETEVDAPVAPDEGEIANVTTSQTTANVTLRTAPQNNGPISNYQVIVFRVKDWIDTVTEAGNSAPDYNESIERKLDYYVTAQFTADSLKPPWLFVVGNDELYGGFKNAELSRGQKYKVFNRAITKDGSQTLYGAERLVAQIDVKREDVVDDTRTDPSTGGVSTGVIAAVVVIIIILVLVGIVGGVLFRKRRRQAEREPTSNLDKARSLPMVNVSSNNLLLSCDAPDTGADAEEAPAQKPEELEGPIYGNVQPDSGGEEEIKPVPVDRFAEYITGLRRGKDSAMKKQYKRLNNGQLFSWDVAKKPENKVKNRYGNIIAYDHSRIVLPFIKNDEHSDYINANYLHGFDGAPKTYIACQGPVTGTFPDFWRMVWLEKPGLIVMLTNLIENGRVKCHQYWPEDKAKYGDITVINHKSETFADYVVRSFIVTKSGTNEKRHVRQFHFLVWPDKGVPQHATAVLGLRRKVTALHRNSKSPLLVYCSAGIGRTGAFVVVDAMLESAKQENVVDVFNYVQMIRNDRISMVQTEEQYVFIYMAILEALTCGNTEIPTQDMRIVVRRLSAVDPETRVSGFESEFQRLELITSADITERKDDAGRKSDNAAKNRYPNIVPLNESRVLLKNSADKNYINASFVDAFRERDAFIMTQAPLKNTRADFWQMIWDYDIGTIVMLNELKEQGQVYPVYWPNEGSVTFDKFTVEAVSEEIFHDFTERIFKLSLKEGSQTGRQVRHFQVTGWPEKGVLANLKGVLDLVEVIERSQRKCGTAPVVVQCSNGVGRSGTLCAVLSILDRLKSEQVLDIFQAVKVLRLTRPDAVETTAQYVFCYNVVQKYLDSFDNYANFT